MLKWFARVCITIVALLAILSAPVLADDSSNVQVVAVPYYGWGISNFTVVVVSDTQVDATWTNGTGVTNVMLRAKYGSMPIDRTDGYQVYEGAGESATDNSMNFDEVSSIIYYRIWAYKDGGWLDSEVNTAEAEGIIMTLMALLLFAVSTTIATFAIKSGRRIVSFLAAGAWMLNGVYCYGVSSAVWDVYYALFWLSMGMVFVCVLIPSVLKEKTENDIFADDVDRYDRPLYEAMEADKKDRERMDRLFGKRRRRTKLL